MKIVEKETKIQSGDVIKTECSHGVNYYLVINLDITDTELYLLCLNDNRVLYEFNEKNKPIKVSVDNNYLKTIFRKELIIKIFKNSTIKIK